MSLRQKKDLLHTLLSKRPTCIINTKLSLMEPRSNAWLIVLDDDKQQRFFFAIEWTVQGNFIRRNSDPSTHDQPTLSRLVKWPEHMAEVTIDPSLRIITFKNNQSTILYTLEGNEALSTHIEPEVTSHLNFLREVEVMREFGIC